MELHGWLHNPNYSNDKAEETAFRLYVEDGAGRFVLNGLITPLIGTDLEPEELEEFKANVEAALGQPIDWS